MDKPHTSPQRRPYAFLRAFAGALGALPVAELSTALSATVGFALVTWFFASLLTPMVWALGAGLYLLGLAGFRLVWTVAVSGIYVLVQDDEE